MTALRTAAQQALEALQAYGSHVPNCDHLVLLTSLPPQRKPCSCGLSANITAIRAALAEPVQEPVAWRYVPSEVWGDPIVTQDPKTVELARQYGRPIEPLYTAPPQRKPLTDEEIDNIWDSEKAFADIYAIVRAIERAHGIT